MYLVFTFDEYYPNGGYNDLIYIANTLEEITNNITITTQKYYTWGKGLHTYYSVTIKDKVFQEITQIVDANNNELIFECGDYRNNNMSEFYIKNTNHWLFENAIHIEQCTLNIYDCIYYNN